MISIKCLYATSLLLAHLLGTPLPHCLSIRPGMVHLKNDHSGIGQPKKLRSPTELRSPTGLRSPTEPIGPRGPMSPMGPRGPLGPTALGVQWI